MAGGISSFKNSVARMLSIEIGPMANAIFPSRTERIQRTILRSRKRVSSLSLFMICAFLLAGCSNPTAVEQLANPIPVTNVLSPTEMAPVPTALPASTVQPTPENMAAPQSISPSISETEQPTLGSTRISAVDQMEEVYVPAGEFIMGTDDKDAKTTIEGGVAYPENPSHTVYLDGYWIDKYEVTTGQYALCVDAGVCRLPWSPGSETQTRYFGEPEYSNYPVIWVSWFMARAYCEWAGRRLPTEAEREKAARGTDGRKYPWGNDPVSGERVNYCDVDCPRSYANKMDDDGYPGTAPVGSYPEGASPYGAMDMAGNVWEWTGTLLKTYPYDATDGREDLEASGHRVWRGGPYSNGPWWMRTSLRYHSVPQYWWFNLGFRCASSE